MAIYSFINEAGLVIATTIDIDIFGTRTLYLLKKLELLELKTAKKIGKVHIKCIM